MEKAVSEIFIKHPALLEFGENFIRYVYDSSIDTFLSIYEIRTEIKKPFGKEIQFLINTFSEEQIKEINLFTKIAAFYVANLELNFFECHTEYEILIEENQERIALSDICNKLRENVLGKNGVISYVSKYDLNLEDSMDYYFTFQYKMGDGCREHDVAIKELPEYYLKRPEILNFGKVFVKEVFDYAIDLWYEIIDGNIENELLKKMMYSFSQNQKVSLKKLVKRIIEDSILKVTGFFESFDYWLITYKDGKNAHISLTDPEEEDFERNELAFDMHNETENGIINLFSKYGL